MASRRTVPQPWTNALSTSSQRNKTPALKRLNMYERSLQQKSDRAQRLKSMETELMTNVCTFTPNTVKSASSNRTATTNASSGGESVFDRLYRGGSVASSHRSPMLRSASRQQRARSSFSRSPTAARSTVSRTSTAVSTRVEELYAEGVRKARRRPKTDKQERELRERRREEKEANDCTFRPKLHWGNKAASDRKTIQSRQKSSSPLKPPKRNLKTPSPSVQPRLPKEIIVSPPLRVDKNRPWNTPKRENQATGQPSLPTDFMLVSPLRDPSFDESEMSTPSLTTPRIVSCITVACESVALTQGEETEYGSI